jgi:hypothetical protein
LFALASLAHVQVLELHLGLELVVRVQKEHELDLTRLGEVPKLVDLRVAEAVHLGQRLVVEVGERVHKGGQIDLDEHHGHPVLIPRSLQYRRG